MFPLTHRSLLVCHEGKQVVAPVAQRGGKAKKKHGRGRVPSGGVATRRAGSDM